MSRTIQCTQPGLNEETFVCQHLVKSLSTQMRVGFFYSHEPRGDAWCRAGEEVRVREGGESGDWNERPEQFAGISLLCGGCYDEIRALNQG